MMEFPDFLKNLNPKIYLDSEDYIVLDFEVSGDDFGSSLNPDSRIVCGSFSSPRFGVGTCFVGTEEFDEWVERIKSVKFIVAHHAKYELGWLYRLGISPGSVLIFDTLLAEYCLLGNRKADLDLDSTCKRYGIEGKESVVKLWIQAGIDPATIPRKRLGAYVRQDVKSTTKLFLKQRKLLEENGLLPVLFTRCLTTIVLTDIEAQGMFLDSGEVEKEFRKTLEDSGKLQQEINEITGGINPKSPKQVAEFLYDKLKFEELRNRRSGKPDRTPTGGRKTDEATIAQLTVRSPEQRRFSDAIRAYSPVKKRLETLNKLYDCVRSGDFLYANFNQAVTRTHRLSSSGRKYKIQFQNIDRTLKRLFRARERDWLIGSADGKQLEFRVAIEASQDPQGIEDIRNKIDVHINTARAIYGKEKISKQERYGAKPFTFRPIYGGTGGTPEIQRYCRWFQGHYNGLYKTQSQWTNEVVQRKSIRISSGLILYWPDCHADSRGNITHRTEIFNYPIQSFATADIIPISLVYTWYRMRGMRSFIINTVHDSVVAEIHPDEVETWKEIVKLAFTDDVFNYLEKVYNYKFRNVPLGVTWDLGEHWDEGKEEEYEKEYNPIRGEDISLPVGSVGGL